MQSVCAVLAHVCLVLCINLIYNILVFVITLLGGPEVLTTRATLIYE